MGITTTVYDYNAEFRFMNLEEVVSEMKRNGLQKAVKTRVGSWYPFREGDTIVSTKS